MLATAFACDMPDSGSVRALDVHELDEVAGHGIIGAIVGGVAGGVAGYRATRGNGVLTVLTTAYSGLVGAIIGGAVSPV